MNIVLISDAFPPLRSSAAVQLRDLSREFEEKKNKLTVMLPDSNIKSNWILENMGNIRILRLKCPPIKDISYLRRSINELLMPYFMYKNLKKSPYLKNKYDGIIWYSPSIFHGPFIQRLKKISKCNAYLIIRDIFPEWAVDIGVMKRGAIYKFFNFIAQYQYSIADIIGVQTEGNLKYFKDIKNKNNTKLEVLQNWLDSPLYKKCSIRINETKLKNRFILIYAGNMGVNNGMDTLIDLASHFKNRDDLGFLFVGRGTDVDRLKKISYKRKLDNTLFYDEIDPDEIPDLYSQCHIGMVALDIRHRSHNIPGKFLTYIQSGLPVIATINPGNDLVEIIRKNDVGMVCENNSIDYLSQLVDKILINIKRNFNYKKKCINLFEEKFSVKSAADQILYSLENTNKK